MNRKVVFILKTIEQQRCIKRINAFIDAGIDVEVYGFQRFRHMKPNLKFEIHNLGEIEEHSSYLHRNSAYMKALPVIKKYRNEPHTLFYLFGLDLALPLILFGRIKNYIYEESDLIHTKFKSRILVKLMERIDKKIIQKSKVSVVTSEGFNMYHYPDGNVPKNICVLPNKLNRKCLSFVAKPRELDFSHLTVGFVGFFRYDSIYNFLKITAELHPEITVKLFGANSGWKQEQIDALRQYDNVKIMGPFKNPDELAQVYAQIDLVVSTYDVVDDNPRYAEPNKIYEAIYFDTPIIVTSHTFLAQKVEKLGIGYQLNAMNREEITNFWTTLTEDNLRQKKEACSLIDKSYCIDSEENLFNMLNTYAN